LAPLLVDFFAECCPFEEIYPVVKVDRWHVDEFYRIRVYLKIIALQSEDLEKVVIARILFLAFVGFFFGLDSRKISKTIGIPSNHRHCFRKSQ
jgi:hypothetical protein